MRTVALLTVAALGASAAAEEAPWPFFAFCMDTHDSAKRSLDEQAALLAELGYDGAGHLWLDELPDRLATLDAHGLKLFQVYFRVNIAAQDAPYDPRLEACLPLLAGRGTMLAVLMTGLPPSEPKGDARAVAILQQIADLAAPHGVRVALYPHAGDWLERVEDGLRLVKQAQRPNLGVMFNLCHWLKVDDEARLEPLLEQAAPHLLAVSLHGADSAAAIQNGTGDWIQPLGEGTFDIAKLLALLEHIGFDGPIGLQCYGLEGDARLHLEASINAWRRLTQETDAR